MKNKYSIPALCAVLAFLVVYTAAHAQNGTPLAINPVTNPPSILPSQSWVDDSATATTTSTILVPATTSRQSLHVWNMGSATVCMNYSAVAAVAGTTSGCATGSVPIPSGSAWLEDAQSGNTSAEAVSFICVSGTCPLTIKVR